MGIVVVALVVFAVTAAVSASRSVPWWSPWLAPLLVAGIFALGYAGERRAAGEGGQPGLVVLVGAGSVALLAGGILAGYGVRAWRARRGR